MLSTGPGKETASGNGSLFKWHLSAFVLRQRSAYPSKRSDLRRLCRTTNLQLHPGVPGGVTWLQQYVAGVFFFFSFFFAFCFVEHLNSLLFCLLLQMTEDALIYSFSLVYSPTPIGNTVIVKTNPAKVLIECHYQRYAQLPPHSPKKHKKKSIIWVLPATPADAWATFLTQTHLWSFRSLIVIFQTALKSCCHSLLAQGNIFIYI